ncbi:MAG: 3-hydroxylacyl-ACP dehydratase [Gammaproteobacteria bacterium]|nr:3-hydroxylacyl-ACP dehydratase [Gammaproteobacteria bacterium]
MLIDRDALSELIPHAGEMSLLDGVVAWDEEKIVCVSNSHRSIQNPLRGESGLSALIGIEYGAQAMAVHGGLLAQRAGKIVPPGYLVALRQVELKIEWLDRVAGELRIEARRLIGQGGQFIYQITLYGEDRLLLEGRVTVIAQP